MSVFKGLTYRDNYEEAMAYLSQEETKHALSFDFENPPEELRDLIAKVMEPRSVERSKWLNGYAARCANFDEGQAWIVLSEEHLNNLRYLNRYLRKVNEKLKQDGYFVCGFDTSKKHQVQIYSRYPRWIAHTVFFFDFIWNRVFPKLDLTRKFYYRCTNKVKKVYPRPEVLGRLYYCGFDVVAERYVHDRYMVIARKKRIPCRDPHSYSYFIKLRRVGKNGDLFYVYKFRTMYAYSEFLQQYVYENNKLKNGGKFNEDFRVSGWGRILRRLWLDEWPMFINVFKGQMKLVGVRPLSQQYFGLYSQEMRELRTQVKPGMLPPYYKDMPETIEEIQESEKKYIESYLKHPFWTDWKYFWCIVSNIVFHRKRSS